MEIEKIKLLVDVLRGTSISEIEIREVEDFVRITRENKQDTSLILNEPSISNVSEMASVEMQTKSEEPIRSHLVGTIYLSPGEGLKPYLEVGQMVKIGDVICQIEAMKMRNFVESDKAGKVIAILVEDGSPVEYNQPIMMLEPVSEKALVINE